jgi:hypothetical protein
MSKMRMTYPQADLSELVESPTLSGVPKHALWWRLRALPGADGYTHVMQIDDMDNPTLITVTWSDEGRDETADPFAIQVHDDRDEPPYLGFYATITSVSGSTTWLDALDVEPPTSNPRWEPLTRPGTHRHPSMMDNIEQQRKERGLSPTWFDDLYIGRR